MCLRAVSVYARLRSSEFCGTVKTNNVVGGEECPVSLLEDTGHFGVIFQKYRVLIFQEGWWGMW
ncbi:hypothetical protein PAT3040_05726 [Paenibacillus agaridevorans]|uniref:Uncharacterized protein n=1 Tax=Paenibacillus agaridevorans TaxID=171404 RepID=A0A2R5F4D9_9BACL|nr:hypothetical protein PAT3040_05726 [Paenibacillus agaridevorans]